MPLPVLGPGLRMQHERVGLGALQDCVRFTRDMIGRLRIGEWKSISHVFVIFVLLTRRTYTAGEPVVQPHQSAT